jgi:CheY-like chemotaxis protein
MTLNMARILLIEDDQPLRQALARLISRNGYDVVEADNGKTALQKIAGQPTDAVITDMIMPEMEGVETIQALRRGHPSAKIIAISGGGRSSADACHKIANALGVQKFLSKPIDPWELLEVLRDLVGPSEHRTSDHKS